MNETNTITINNIKTSPIKDKQDNYDNFEDNLDGASNTNILNLKYEIVKNVNDIDNYGNELQDDYKNSNKASKKISPVKNNAKQNEIDGISYIPIKKQLSINRSNKNQLKEHQDNYNYINKSLTESHNSLDDNENEELDTVNIQPRIKTIFEDEADSESKKPNNKDNVNNEDDLIETVNEINKILKGSKSDNELTQIKVQGFVGQFYGNVIGTVAEKDKLNKIKLKIIRSHLENKRDIDTLNKQMLENNLQKLCFICDKFCKVETFYCSDNCNHSFCYKCGKAYYEERIEQNDVKFKCPIYKCKTELSLNILFQFVSDKHAEVLKLRLNDLQCNVGGDGDESVKKPTPRPSTDRENKDKVGESENLLDKLKDYGKHNVIKFGDDDIFRNLSKNSDNFCKKCGEPAIYGKYDSCYAKCLNCLERICKFCGKTITVNHFDLTSNNYCRIYYRKTVSEVTKQSFCKEFLFSFALYIVGYIFLVCCLLNHFSLCLQKLLRFPTLGGKEDKEEHNINTIRCKNCFHIVIMMILVIILTPLIIVLMPFFPSLISAYNVNE